MGITRSYSRGFSNCSTRDKNTSRVPPDNLKCLRKKRHKNPLSSDHRTLNKPNVLSVLCMFMRDYWQRLGVEVFLNCASEDLESDQWTLSCTKHQTLCPSYSLFFRPSTPLLSSFTCSLLCCALAHQNNKALMFHSTSPLFAATDLTKLHYKPESSILSGPIH